MFKGSIPALVTPFTETGAVDEASFAAHVDWVIAEGSHGVVPVGTMLAQIEQSTKIMSAAHKGMHTAQAEELQLILDLLREDPS